MHGRQLGKETYLPMSTTQIVATLFQLQQLDLELERLTSEQQTLTTSLQGDSALQKLRKEHTIAQQQLRSGLQAQQEAEWALEDLNRRITTQEQRLYSGTGTNSKEIYALQQEVEHLRAQQSHQEEMVLEIMDAADALQEMVQRKEEALRQAEEDWTRESAAQLTRRDQLEARGQEVQARRTKLAETVDASLLKRYDALRRVKQGRAISKVEQNLCQWCRMQLTPSELQHLRAARELQTCSNCGRILYYER